MGKKARKNQKNEVESQTSMEDVFDLTSNEVVNEQPSCPNPALTSLTNNGILRIHVNNIGFSTTDDDIERFFSDCHPIKIKIVRGTGNSRCFCFVDFVSKADFMKSLDLDKSLLNGRRLHIRVAEKQISRHYSETIYDSKNSIVRKLRETNSTEERFVRTGESLCSPPASAQRPKLFIAPRSISSEIEELPKRNPNIFGDALPVDTASKDREIEEILRERQRAESSVSSIDKLEDTKSTQPSKRLNMFKPKCSTSVSITSPGFVKSKAFFPPSSAKSALKEEPQTKGESSISTPPALNIWEQRKQERAKQIQKMQANKENTQEISKKPSISSDISYAKAAKTNLPDLPAVPKTQEVQPKKETVNSKKGSNRKNKKGKVGSEEDFSVGSSSSNSSKIALAAVVSVAKLHQKKHYNKGNRPLFNSFMPIINPYYAACVPPMGMELQPMMPIGPGFMNSPFYLSGPFSDYGLYGSDAWSQPDSNTAPKRGKKNSYKIKKLNLKMDLSAQEFLPKDLKTQESGLMVIRQMKRDDECSSTSQEPLTIDIMGQGNSEGNATPVESWDEVSSTAPESDPVCREPLNLQVV